MTYMSERVKVKAESNNGPFFSPSLPKLWMAIWMALCLHCQCLRRHSVESALLSPLLLEDREVSSSSQMSPWNSPPQLTYTSQASQIVAGADHSTLLRLKNAAYMQLHQHFLQFQSQLNTAHQENLVLVSENKAFR